MLAFPIQVYSEEEIEIAPNKGKKKEELVTHMANSLKLKKSTFHEPKIQTFEERQENNNAPVILL